MTSDEGPSHAKVILTRRALRDLRSIETYSVERFGQDVADKYIDQLNLALQRLKESPGLLRPEPEFASKLRFYRCNKHYFVCDQIDDCIFVLTVVHTSMDLPRRIGDFEPGLVAEADILHRKLRGKSD